MDFYNFQHHIFKEVVTYSYYKDLKESIDSKNPKVIQKDIDVSERNYFGRLLPDWTSIEFVKANNRNFAWIHFTPFNVFQYMMDECSDIIITVTDKIYYFTIEAQGQRYALCRWDDEKHYIYEYYNNVDKNIILNRIDEIVLDIDDIEEAE